MLGRLAHPNIIPIHDFGFGEAGRHHYTMKLGYGITLHDVLTDLADDIPETLVVAGRAMGSTGKVMLDPHAATTGRAEIAAGDPGQGLFRDGDRTDPNKSPGLSGQGPLEDAGRTRESGRIKGVAALPGGQIPGGIVGSGHEGVATGEGGSVSNGVEFGGRYCGLSGWVCHVGRERAIVDADPPFHLPASGDRCGPHDRSAAGDRIHGQGDLQ